MNWRILVHCLTLFASLATTLAVHTPAAAQSLGDSGFEQIAVGPLAITGKTDGWEVQKTGRDVIQPRLTVTGVEDVERARSGRRCVALSIPEDTVGFEFVTIGQRVRLDADSAYEARVWVRWPDGPDSPPDSAGPTSGHRSAIVSFWARHRDGHGDFAGRDQWLFDNRWHQLTFRFRATHSSEPTLIYVSLLPHQTPAATTILVDDFELHAVPATAGMDRRGQVVRDADFSAQQSAEIAPPWFFANFGGDGIRGEVVTEGAERHVRIAMDRATSNYESAQLWQHVQLRAGARYEVSCRLRWDDFASDAALPIVNYGIYHEATRTWYGPVDQVLEKTGQWRTYRFTHIPPFDGPWKLYVQLNGWGNFGNGLVISCDDFQCLPSR